MHGSARINRWLVASVLLSIFLALPAQSLVLKPKALFNLNWKFIQGNPTGAQASTFNDAAWQTVSVPHSASYDAPTVNAELNFYGSPQTPNKDYWYRKKFLCPASAQKVFIQFGAVMQSVTVYVNGTQVGTHYNSGYTGFFFDISSNVTRGDTTCIALHCNINNDNNIPPGGSGWTSNGGAAPDYLLFSGMYRDVYLVFKDSVYVPVRGQRITTTGSTASPTVHAITNVRNDGTAAKSVTVDLTLRSSSGASVATGTLNQSVAAGNTSAFDITTGAVSSPSLWSPTSPTLYSLQTLVSVGGTVVDSIIEQIGLRFYSWSAGTPGGLSINGIRTELKGVCLGQWMGWIENAVPDSRFVKQVAMIKDMGANSIRCSHYPRADAFYHACDSVGMLVLCEVPNWGVSGGFTGLTTFWNRMYSCDSEMVLDGYNHPCIWGWSLFNEPSETTLGTNFTNESNIIHALDPVAGSGRVTLIANFSGMQTGKYGLDIMGLNYDLTYSTNLPIVNTEDYTNWFRVFIRGCPMDLNVAAGSEAAAEVNQMKNDWSTSDKCAGAHFWCFMDYCSFRNQTGREGIVDRLWIPKNVYYMFKSNFSTTTATDYWANGTPTTIDLKADLSTLRADGSDISQIVATLRDASGKCMQTNCNITFTASPASAVAALYPGDSTAKTSGNPVTVAVEGGRAGVLLRTTTTPGNITVTATSSCGLSAATVTLSSQQVTESYYTGAVPVMAQLRQVNASGQRLGITSSARGHFFLCPSERDGYLRIVNMQGKTVFYQAAKKGEKLFVNRLIMGPGVFYATWENGATRASSRLTMVN
jgi:beta-galactosidase